MKLDEAIDRCYEAVDQLGEAMFQMGEALRELLLSMSEMVLAFGKQWIGNILSSFAELAEWWKKTRGR